MSYDNIFKPEIKKVINIVVLVAGILFTLVYGYNAIDYIIGVIGDVFGGDFYFTFTNILYRLYSIVYYVGHLLIVWGFVGSLLLKNKNFRLISIIGLVAMLVIYLIYYLSILISNIEYGFFSNLFDLATGYISNFFFEFVVVLLLILVDGNVEKEK